MMTRYEDMLEGLSDFDIEIELVSLEKRYQLYIMDENIKRIIEKIALCKIELLRRKYDK